MQLGEPSKYQSETRALLKQLEADSVMLIVLGGKRGNGMAHSVSGSALDLANPIVVASVLRAMADQIEGGSGRPGGVHVAMREDE